MAPPLLKATTSTVNSRVSLISEVKAEPDLPSSSSYTSLRRSTRSTTRTADDETTTSLNLSSYAFAAPPRKRVKLEPKTPSVKAEDDEPLVKLEDTTPILPSSGSATPKKGLPLAKRSKAHPEPAKWREQYALIERMRAGIDAPVDTMGCERPRTAEGLDAKTLRFHVLISLMLSSQTKDAVTSQAVLNLHNALPGGLSAETLAIAPADIVSEAISKVGFWRRKSEYIQAAARKLLERPGDGKGDVPQTIEELCELKGVGPKMGFLALQVAWDINAGIGVDVHVHRITNRLKWHKPPTKTPEETRQVENRYTVLTLRINLESWLPSELHKPINPMLVGFGQVICLPVGPRCDICLLGQQKLCPSRVAVNAGNRKQVAYTFTAEDEVNGRPKVEIAYEEDVKVEAVKMEPTEGVEPTVKEEPV